MKILMWILIAGIPCAIVMHALGIVMMMQHWPLSTTIRPAANAAMLLLLMIAWVFAMRSRKRNRGITFESF